MSITQMIDFEADTLIVFLIVQHYIYLFFNSTFWAVTSILPSAASVKIFISAIVFKILRVL